MPLIRRDPDKPTAARAAALDLAAAFASASAEERWAAVREAAVIPASVPALAKALNEESDRHVREAILTALARIATPESALAVVPHLRSDDANLRTGALDALRAMPEAIAPHLARLLHDADADVRFLACDLACNARNEEAPRLLCALLHVERHANVCGAAVEALAEIGNADAVPALLACAARFPNDPFLAFAIKIAADRLCAGSSAPRG